MVAAINSLHLNKYWGSVGQPASEGHLMLCPSQGIETLCCTVALLLLSFFSCLYAMGSHSCLEGCL